MTAFTTDRQAEADGGFFVRPENARGTDEALLVLSDGSVWKGRSVGSAAVTTGDVRLVGALAAVGETGLLSGLDVNSFRRHLSGQDSGEGTTVRGCIAATGATFPLHAAVALAVARGEIGRP